MPTPITASTLSALLSAALAQKPTRPLVLALDGRCGSGKTTLANGLAAQFPGCTLLRTDDFYLPPARRSPDWAHTPCANMDLTRLRDEALRPAYAGQTVDYRAYSCREGAYLPPVQLPAQPLVILEGSYSHHPLLRPYETLRVFVTCTKAEQTRRLQAREGARYADFAARWVPLEEGYFARYGIAESADFVVETTDSPSLPVMGIDGSRGFSSSSVFSLGEEVSSTTGGFSCGLVMAGGISGIELMVVGVSV